MAQVVEFAGQLNVTLQNVSEDENTHGLAEAYNRLAQVMDELCIPYDHTARPGNEPRMGGTHRRRRP